MPTQMPPEEEPAVLLALLWAALSNVSATAFWAIAFLLLPEHQSWQEQLQKELRFAVGKAGPNRGSLSDGTSVLDRDENGSGAGAWHAHTVASAAQSDNGLLQACIDEAIRLRAEGACRSVQTKVCHCAALDCRRGQLSSLSVWTASCSTASVN